MAAELYPDLFQDFFHEMGQPHSLNEGFQKAFEILEHPLHIGKVCLSFTPRRPGFFQGIRNSNLKLDMFVSKASFNSEVNQNYQFMMSDDIVVEVTIYATTSCDQWSMKQISQLAMIAETTFVFASRLRMADIAQANSMSDTLTGLPNYVSFCSTGRQHCMVGSIGKFTAMLINIKDFNSINFRYGFVIGDQVLRKFSAFLQTGMLPEETVARHGGDSFLLLVKKERADDIVAKVSRTVITAVASDATEIPLDIEADITRFDIPESTKDFSTCLIELSKRFQDKIQDNANSRVKKASASEMAEKMEAFNNAIVEDLFQVYYQPKFSLEDNSVLGAEALVRKKDGSKLLLPDDFIPEIENDDRIFLLDYYVLDQVCRDLLDWTAEGKAPLVSVNFSPRHLEDEAFVDRIMNIIDRYGVDPSYIEIEFTSIPDVSQYASFKKFIGQMKEYDLTVSLDDFGSGNSPILSLSELGANGVKIDKTLTARIGEKGADIIIKSLINIAAGLNMDVTVLGIETEAQKQFYIDNGCVVAQGNLFAEPMCRDEFEKFL